MLNMYSDHYRLTANHVDGARARRFRIRAKGKPRKPITTTGPRDTPKDAQALLDLLQESCTDAERVAGATGLQRHLGLATVARQRLEDHRRSMLKPNSSLGGREYDGGVGPAVQSGCQVAGATP